MKTEISDVEPYRRRKKNIIKYKELSLLSIGKELSGKEG